jgi:nitrite reductase/ring-hydroxylating ferredoxin subunit
VSEERSLGRLEDFPDRAATPARYRKGEREIGLLVVRHGDELRAYEDVCPHQFLPLTQRGSRVLSANGERLRCTNHGAEFAVADGRALGGPTGGCGLTPVTVEIDPDGTVLVKEGSGSGSA